MCTGKSTGKPLLRYQHALAYLNSFINLETGAVPYSGRVYRLDKLKVILRHFKNPEKKCPAVHIAGSKGKGSTASLIASALTAAGFRTGLYLSPHVYDIRERISVDGRPVGEKALTGVLDKIKRFLDIHLSELPEGTLPSFFEVLTIAAFLVFRESQCDYVVLETGLGGRLDATNVVLPLASVLTVIELEHENILGNSIEKIAREKSGIIKQGIPVFSGMQDESVKKVIRKKSREMHSPVLFLQDEIERLSTEIFHDGTRMSCKLRNLEEFHASLPLYGEYQSENAALALLVISRLFPGIPLETVASGFRAVSLPGRMQVVSRKPLVVIDGAHTPGSVARVCRSFLKMTKAPRVLLFAVVKGKNYAGMISILAPHFSRVVVSTPGFFRKSDPVTVYNAFQRVHADVFYESDPEKAFQRVLEIAGKKMPVLITGSFYLAAELLALMKKKRGKT